MKAISILGCLLTLAVAFCSPAEAAGRWVKNCNGRTCQMTWVEDRPATAPTSMAWPRTAAASQACNCAYCNCDEPGGKAGKQCVRFNCAHQRSVLTPGAHAAVAGCSSCSSGSGSSSGGWYLGKNVGRAKPRWRN